MTLHVFNLLGSAEHVIATDEDDAWTVWLDHNGEKRADHDDDEWVMCPDDKLMTVHDEGDEEDPETKTCGEWAASDGRGFLGCALPRSPSRE